MVTLLKIKRGESFFQLDSIPISVSRTVKTRKFKLLYFRNETCYGNGNLCKVLFFVYLQPSVSKNSQNFAILTLQWRHCENHLLIPRSYKTIPKDSIDAPTMGKIQKLNIVIYVLFLQPVCIWAPATRQKVCLRLLQSMLIKTLNPKSKPEKIATNFDLLTTEVQ